MKKIVKYCKICEQNPKEYKDYFNKMFTKNGLSQDFVDWGIIGYYTTNENNFFCQVHPNEKLEKSSLSNEEYNTLSLITNDFKFIRAMEELKNTDIIEFQLKMSQFTTQISQSQAIEESNTPKCPHCKSTNIKSISGLNRGISIAMLGVFSKKINKSFECDNCGYTW